MRLNVFFITKTSTTVSQAYFTTSSSEFFAFALTSDHSFSEH